MDEVWRLVAQTILFWLQTLDPRDLGDRKTAILRDTAVVYVHADFCHFTTLEEILVDEDVAKSVFGTEQAYYFLDREADLALRIDNDCSF